MANRTVSVKLTAEVASYVQGMKNAASATQDLGKKTLDHAEKNEKAWNTVGTSLVALGAAAGIGVGLAVSKFAEFDKAMSSVQAATHESAEGMESLREAALEAGARTAFSATEAAKAIEELAKAGVSTTDILNGGLNGALDLAAAGSLDVGDAAEIAATALVQFSLDGAKVPHVADLLAAAAGKAQGGVSDMGMALKQAGLVAAATGLTIEETTAGLASFAAAGLIGSDAGTSFKSMLQRLNPQSEEAKGLMEQLGFSAYDLNGNFIGLEGVADELQTSLAGLTVEQRSAAMSTLFGSDAVRAANVLYEEGGAGIAEWTAKVNDQGYAAETAAIKLDNLSGDLEALGGSFETALIGSGSAANGILREMVQTVTGVVNAYSQMPPAMQTAVTGVAAFTSAAALAGGTALLMVPKIAELRSALVTLGVSARATSLALGTLKFAAIGAGATAAVFGVDAIARAMADASPSVNQFRDSIADFGAGAGTTGAVAKAFGDDLGALAEKIDRANQSQWFSLDLGTTTSDIIEAKDEVKNIDQALAELATSGYADVAAKQWDALTAAGKAQGVTVEELKKSFPGYSDALVKNTTDAKLAGSAQQGLDSATEGVTASLDLEAKSLRDLMAEVRDATGLVLGLRDASRGYEAALDEATAALKENGKTLDTTTEKGRANEAALDAIASSANDVLESMIASGEPLDSVSAKLGTQREALIQTATRFGMTKEAATAYADSVLQIPSRATTTVQTVGMVTGREQAEALARAIAGIPTFKKVTIRYDEVLGTTVQRGNFPGRTTERAAGGWVFGPGTATSDSIPAALSNGEFVVNARSAAQNAALLEAINGNRFAQGGWVGSAAAPTVNVSPAAVDLSALVASNDRLEQRLASIEATVGDLPRRAQQTARAL